MEQREIIAGYQEVLHWQQLLEETVQVHRVSQMKPGWEKYWQFVISQGRARQRDDVMLYLGREESREAGMMQVTCHTHMQVLYRGLFLQLLWILATKLGHFLQLNLRIKQ